MRTWLPLLLVLAPRAALGDPLAAEHIRGDVLIGRGQDLFPTAARAKEHAGDAMSKADPVALRVIADRGEVVEVETVRVDDCVASYQSPYTLTVFVARAALIPRAAAAITKTYPDGTAVQIDRGAPVVRQPLAWREPLFAATAVVPAASQLEYGTPAGLRPGALTAPPGEELVCDPEPSSLADWQAAQRRKNDARNEDRKRARDAARAKADEERAKHPAKTKPKAVTDDEKLGEAATDLLWGYGADDDLGQGWTGADLGANVGDSSYAYVPRCGVSDPSQAWNAPRIAAKTSPPTVGARALPWPNGEVGDSHAYRVGAEVRADLGLRCGRLRVAVPLAGLAPSGGGAGVGMGGKQHMWTPKAGRVVWLDGNPAGTYRGTERYRDEQVELHGDLVCVSVGGIADKVCHDLADVAH